MQGFTEKTEDYLIQVEALFKIHYRSLCFIANNILSDKNAAEDVVQDVFMKLIAEKDNIEIKSSFKGYIFRAIVNAALNYSAKQKKSFVMENAALEVKIGRSPDIEKTLEQMELEELVNQAINLLPPKCKTVFILNRFENMKYKEVATYMGISVKTVENQMGKALRILRSYLRTYIIK